jgi:hypothetical protein
MSMIAIRWFLLASDAAELGERQRCGTAEIERPERSERETLPAVATTVLFGLFITSDLSCELIFHSTGLLPSLVCKFSSLIS